MSVLSQPQALIQKRTLKERQGVSVWVTAREAFWVAMEALRSHKLRSFLTLLGVVIATTTLIVVMSIVNGARTIGPAVAGILLAADFLVHPTFYDPCSLVVLEALACGLPIITTPVPTRIQQR